MMALRRVVHVTTAHPPFDTRIFFRQCRSASTAFEAVLIAPDPGMEERDGVRLVAVPKHVGKLRRLIGTLPAALRSALREQPAIFHLHDPELLPVALILRLRRQPVVFDVHEHFSQIAYETLPRTFRSVARVLTMLCVERLPRWFCSRLVYVTEALRRDTGAPAGKSVVVRNLPSLRDVPDVERTRPIYDIVFVGTISPFRMRVMVEVAEHLITHHENLRWLFVGMPKGTRQWTERTYAGSPVLDHLDMRDRVDFTQVLVLLAQSRVGFNYHPLERRFEVALPVKVLEYMAVGLPTVTTFFSELELLTKPDELVMVRDRTALAHAAAVHDLLENRHYAERLGEAGRAAVRERINWEHSEEPTLLALYDDLADRIVR